MDLPLHGVVCRQLILSDTPPPAPDSNDDAEEADFPTAPLNDLVWSKETIPDRQLCIHMAIDNSGTSYFPHLSTLPQEPTPPEWEPMDNTDGVYSQPHQCP